MNNPPSWAAREESLLLLNAYLDHELDAAAVLDVERRVSADKTLKAEYDRLLELRTGTLPCFSTQSRKSVSKVSTGADPGRSPSSAWPTKSLARSTAALTGMLRAFPIVFHARLRVEATVA